MTAGKHSNMKLRINTEPLTHPLTGVGHYIANLVYSLTASEPSYEYFFLYGDGVSPKFRSRRTETGGVLPDRQTLRRRHRRRATDRRFTLFAAG